MTTRGKRVFFGKKIIQNNRKARHAADKITRRIDHLVVIIRLVYWFSS